MYPLRCQVQDYAWGRLREDSIIPSLTQTAEVESFQQFAELWMGDHVKSPSQILLNGDWKNLNDVMSHEPEKFLGKVVMNSGYSSLPFLFKVLSIKKALSIQVHPNKDTAADLHDKLPEVYKDPNHKPEMAIALTPFEALLGFAAADEINANLDYFYEVRELLSLGDTKITEATFTSQLKEIISLLFSLETEVMEESLKSLNTRLHDLKVLNRNEDLGNSPQGKRIPYLLKLFEEFGNDIGIIVSLFMNYVSLQPGQAVVLKENLLHAYLSGEIMECMACSDNVIRAGLTPKLKDAETLVNITDFSPYNTAEMIQSGSWVKSDVNQPDPNAIFWHTREYTSGYEDFKVTSIGFRSEDPTGAKSVKLTYASPSILIAIRGNGKVYFDKEGQIGEEVLQTGSTLYCKPSTSFEIEKTVDGEDLLVFVAHAAL
mmetsp:Transcript_56385/g.64375  ORF Transcript_56385/g.64375 Transcript_56385/m.64375 type:complete len:430 (-) Transcript_56385:118-1407(-)